MGQAEENKNTNDGFSHLGENFEYRMLLGIQSAMADPYYIRDMDYNVVLWPDSMAKLTGYSEEEAKKIKCYDLFDSKACQGCPGNNCPTHQAVLDRKFFKEAHVAIRLKNGEKRVVLVSNAGIYDEKASH